MRFAILSSGSKQNSFYLESDQAAVLFDVGFSFRTICRHIRDVGGDPDRIQALFVTHEHSDHVGGLESFLKGHHAAVYLADKSRHFLDFTPRRHRPLHHGEAISVGDMTITPFRVNHDAANTFGFLAECLGRRLFLASDIGSFDDSQIKLSRQAHAIAIESNYDEEMLRSGPYPEALKKRIFGPHGHLSNRGAAEFLKLAVTDETRNVFLLHLSENNNRPAIVRRMIDEVLQPRHPQVVFTIAEREKPLGLFEV